MLQTVKENISHGEPDLKLFEWGKIFILNESEELPFERLSLAGIMTGLYNPREWHNSERPTDFYDIKGAVETLLGSLGLKDVILKRDEPEAGYHPEYSCRVYLKDRAIGSLGQADPDMIKRYDIKTDNAFLFEIDIEAILQTISGELFRFEPFAKFPSVVRDLSIVIDRSIESGIISDIIRVKGGKLIESVNVISLYEGEKMGPSKKTISFRIIYRSREGTLDGNVVNRLHENIIDVIRKETGGTLSEG
jgi:phenylalanyl-tRNA synthetase beta chain